MNTSFPGGLCSRTFRPTGLFRHPNRSVEATQTQQPVQAVQRFAGSVKMPTAESSSPFRDFPEDGYDDAMFAEDFVESSNAGGPQAAGDGEKSHKHFPSQRFRYQMGPSSGTLCSGWSTRPPVTPPVTAPEQMNPRSAPQPVQIRAPFTQVVPSLIGANARPSPVPATPTFSDNSRRNRESDRSRLKEPPPLCFMTVTINTMNQLKHYNDEFKRLLEVFGVLVGVQTHPTNTLAKIITLQDQSRTLQLVFHEIDRNLPTLNNLEMHRCVGRTTQDGTFQCLSIRPATQQEQKYRNKLAAVSAKLTHSRMVRVED